jgi:hypothetical protein
MPKYCVYFFNRFDGIDQWVRLDCKTDEEAIARAEILRHTYLFELWDRDRLVRSFPPLTSE